MQTTPSYIGFGKVARRFDVSPHTIWRWHKVGRGPDKIRLRAIKCGGRWKTRWRWVREFFAALEPGAAGQLVSLAAQQRSHRATVRELERIGIKPVRLGQKPAV